MIGGLSLKGKAVFAENNSAEEGEK